MSTQTVTLRLVADNGQLVGTVRASKAEIDGLGRGAQQAGGAAEQGFSRASAAAERTSTFVTRAKQAVAGFALAFASIQGVQAATKIADTYSNISAQVRLATKSQAEYSTAQAAVFEVAQDSYTALDATANLYARLTRATADLGVSQQRVAGLTETVNKSFIVSGASVAGSTGAIQQFTQALASGVFRGEEFNSVAEQGPRLMQALTDSLGVTRGELRAMAEDGKLTAEVVINALEEQSTRIQDEFSQMPATIERAWVQIGNAVTQYIGQADQASGASRGVAESLSLLARNIDTVIDLSVTAGAVFAAVYGARLASGVAQDAAALAQKIAITRAHTTAMAEDARMEAVNAAAKLRNVEATQAAILAARAEQTARLAKTNALIADARATLAATQATGSAGAASGFLHRAERQLTTALQARSAATAELALLGRQQASVTAQLTAATAANTAAQAASASAMAATGVAARASAAAMGVARGALALVGGPAGAAVLAGAGLIYLVTQMESAEDRARALDKRIRELSGGMEDLGREAAIEELEQAQKRITQLDGEIAGRQQKLQSSMAFSGGDGLLDRYSNSREAEKLKQAADERARLLTIEAQLTDVIHGTTKAVDNYVDAQGRRTAADQQAEDAAKKANESVDEQIKLLDKQLAWMAKGVSAEEAAKRAKLELDGVEQGKIKTLIASERAIAAQTESTKKNRDAAEAASKAWQDYQDQLAKSADALEDAERDVQDELSYQRELNRLLRAGVEASEAEAQVRRAMEPIRSNELDDSRAKLDIEKQITDTLVGQREATQQALQRQREVEEEAQRERVERAQRAADEISRSLTDALYRGFEDGKNIADNFFDTLENTAKTLVLRPVIEFAVQPLAGVISSVLNGGGLGSALGGGLDTALSLDRFQALGDVFFERGVLPLADILGNAGFEELAVSITNLGSYLPMLTKAIPAAAAAYGIFEIARSQRPAGSNIGGTLYGMGALNPITAPFVGLDAVTGGRVFGTKWRTSSQKIAIEFLDQLADVTLETIQRKKRPLGGSNKRRVITDEALALDESVSEVFGEMFEAAREATRALGMELGSFDYQVKESIKGLKGDELQAKLDEIISGAADAFVRQAVPVGAALDDMRQEGENLVQTLVRVTQNTLTVNDALRSIGQRQLNFEQVDQLLRGTSLEAVSAFFDRFSTDAEKFSRVESQVKRVFESLNLEVPRSESALRELVQGLDLTTEAGMQAVRTLANSTDALSRYYDTMDAGTKAVEASARSMRLQGERAANDARTDMFLRLDDDSERVKANFEAAVESSREVLNLYARGFSDADGLVKQAKARILADIRKQEQGRQVTLDFFAQQVSDASETLRAAVLRAAESVTVVDDRNRLVSEEGLARAQVVVFGRALEDLSNNALRLMDAAAVIPEAFERVRFESSQLEELLVDELVESTGEVGFQLGYFGNSVRVLADATNRVAKSMQVDAQLVKAETRGVATILNARAQIGTQTPVDVYANNFDVYREAISSLNYQFYEGGLSAEELNRRVSVLASNMETLTGISGEGVDSLGALQSALSRGVEAFYYSQEAIEQREAERADLERRRLEGLYSSGLSSLRYYFDELAKISGEMTVAAEAAEPALVATEEALGRLTSAAYVFGESVKAVEDGLAFYQTAEQQREFGGNVQAARAVAAAAQQLADIVTTRSGFEAQQALSGEAAFAETESTALRDISRLVESVSAFDAAGLERAFVRASVALRDGTVTLDQYTALIDYSQSVYLGASGALEDLTGSAQNLEAVARERAGLERQLLELQGDTAAIRALERAELFEANRELYDRIQALRDEQTAAQAAAEIAREREGLETRLLQLQDNTAALRARERSALDASNQSLYDQITALEDQRAATDAAAASARDLASAQQARDTALRSLQAYGERLADEINQIRLQALADVDTARGGVVDALDRLAQASEASSEALAEAQRQVADGIGDYLRELRGTTAGSGNAFERRAANTAQFRDVSSRALSGDITAAQGIVAAAQAYLGSVRETAGSSIEIAREEGRVRAQLLAVQALNAVGVKTQTDAVATAADAQRAYTEALSAATAAGIEYTRTVDSGADTFRLALNAYNEAQAVATQVRADMAEQEQSVLDRYRGLVSQMEEFQAKTAGILESLKPIDELGGLLQEYADALATIKMAEANAQASAALIIEQANAQAIANRERLTAQLGGNGAAAKAALDNVATGANTPLPGVAPVAAAATQIVGSLDAAAAAIAASAVPLRAEVTAAGIELRAYARGGSYPGGLALVGEEGPELINFSAPGQVYNAAQTRQALGTDTRKLEALVERMSTEIVALKSELREIKRSSEGTHVILRRVTEDGDAMRTAEAV